MNEPLEPRHMIVAVVNCLALT